MQFGYIKKLPAALCLALFLISGFAHADDNSLVREANLALSHKDYSGAFSKFSALAHRGNVSAQFNVGAFYLNGQGVQRDEKQAYEWFAKSAAQGDARAIQVMQNAEAQAKADAQAKAQAKADAQAKAQTKAKAKAASHTGSRRSRESSSSDYSLGVSLGQTGKMTGISNSSSLGLLGGYKFNSSFGVEVAYNSLYRDAKADSYLSSIYPGTTGTFDLTSISVAGQYTYSLGNNLSLLGSLGLHASSFKIKSSGSGSRTGTANGLIMGLKVQYDLSDSIGVRGGFDTYTESGGMTGTLTEVGVAVITRF
jgi:hypothetical protein